MPRRSASATEVPAPTPQRARLKAAGVVLAAAVSQAPEYAAYGLIALAPLGPQFGPAAMALALLGAVGFNIVASVVGGGRLVGGPRAALSLLTAGLLAGLLPALSQPAAPPIALLLGLLALGIAGAGALQMLFGWLRLGTIVKFTPQPVRLGLTSGIGLLMLASALPVLLGQAFGAGLTTLAEGVQPGALLVGLCALAVTVLGQRARWATPPLLAGLAAAALLHAALAFAGGPAWTDSLIGVPALPSHWLGGTDAAWLPALLSLPVLGRLAGFAVTVAVLATLDSLLVASVVDGRLRQGRDANRELVAQGLANIGAAVIGGQANAPSIPRSLALVLPLPQWRHSVLAYAAAMLALLLLAPGLLGLLPTSAVGGVLVLQGLQLLAPTLWQTPQLLWGRRTRPGRPDLDSRQRWLLAVNWGVTVVVALSTVALGLAWALLIGASFAVLLFVRANMRDVVRRVHSGSQRRSLRIRGPEALQTLQREGGRIAVLELQGALFFGTADALRTRLQALAETVDSAILDLHQVAEIDATGARILLETGEDWALRGKQLVAAEWLEDDPRRRTIMAMATPGSRPGLVFAPDTDLALEAAEDRLLARPGAQAASEHVLTLGETLLGRGLGSADLALLAAHMEQLQVPRGTVLFRVGDPGDAVFVSLAGTIGVRLPGGQRRLASFAPGVCLGEMAVLDRRQRSAEAVAESDLTVLRLSADAFDAIRAEHPVLAALLLNNISLHLSDRVRSLTTELSAWVSRSASGRAPEPAAPPPHGDDERAE